jgi:hypothetical protein
MSDIEQIKKNPDALFDLFNSMQPDAKVAFINRFAHDVFHRRVLISSDGTVLIPNEDVINTPNTSDKAYSKLYKEPIKVNKLELFSKDELNER